jgi:hypothetical protein
MVVYAFRCLSSPTGLGRKWWPRLRDKAAKLKKAAKNKTVNVICQGQKTTPARSFMAWRDRRSLIDNWPFSVALQWKSSFVFAMWHAFSVLFRVGASLGLRHGRNPRLVCGAHSGHSAASRPLAGSCHAAGFVRRWWV